MIRLAPLTAEQCEIARGWRNDALSTLRTPYPLTPEMQRKFYDAVVCDPRSGCRYWAVWGDAAFVGMVGLTDISAYNRNAEISLIIDPVYRDGGRGGGAVRAVLVEAFDQIGLNAVYGEVYACNPAVGFWEHVLAPYGATWAVLPDRKYYAGRFWDGYYFTVRRPASGVEGIHTMGGRG